MHLNLKKKISLISFQRILKLNPYLVCFSNLFLSKTSLKKIFISNYILKILYIKIFPTNFLNYNSFTNYKLQNVANNFLNFLTLKTSKKLRIYFNTLEVFEKYKIFFIKYNNLYFTKDYNFFFKFLNMHFFLNKFKFLFFKHLFCLNFFVKKKLCF